MESDAMTQFTTISEPNPGNGNIPPSNWLQLALLVFSLPWLLLQSIWQKLLGQNEISFKENLALSLIRRYN
jgi:hypothetical protein